MLKKENWSMTTSMRPAAAATSIITATRPAAVATSTITNTSPMATSITMRRYTTRAGNLTTYPPT